MRICRTECAIQFTKMPWWLRQVKIANHASPNAPSAHGTGWPGDPGKMTDLMYSGNQIVLLAVLCIVFETSKNRR